MPNDTKENDSSEPDSSQAAEQSLLNTPSNKQDTPPDNWWRRIGKRIAGGPRDREELLEVLQQGKENGLLNTDALGMIHGVLDVEQTQVRDIMIPRAQMVVVEHDAPADEILEAVIRSGHSRFPVIGENRDEVVGILLAKDLLRQAQINQAMSNERDLNMRDILRSAVFVPESKRLDVLLKEFRSSRNHMAIVVDEYGGVAGLVTIEDVLEEIVGDIDDEYDDAEGAFILRQDSERFLVRALTPIEEFNRYFGTEFSDDEFDTVGGFVTHAFGHMPRRGESTVVGRYLFNVQRADSRRIHLFQVIVMPESADTDNG